MCGQKNEEDEEKKKGFCTFTLAAVRSTVGGVRLKGPEPRAINGCHCNLVAPHSAACAPNTGKP